jgi:hypothetical protein
VQHVAREPDARPPASRRVARDMHPPDRQSQCSVPGSLRKTTPPPPPPPPAESQWIDATDMSHYRCQSLLAVLTVSFLHFCMARSRCLPLSHLIEAA